MDIYVHYTIRVNIAHSVLWRVRERLARAASAGAFRRGELTYIKRVRAHMCHTSRVCREGNRRAIVNKCACASIPVVWMIRPIARPNIINVGFVL